MSNGNGKNQGTDSSVESTAVQMNGSDKTDQILSIVSDIQADMTGVKTDITELKSDMNKVKTRLTSVEGSVEAIGSQLDGFRDKIEGQDSKIAGQDSKIEGQSRSNDATYRLFEAQDAKIESSRITTVHKVIAIIIAAILFLVAVWEYLPAIAKNFLSFNGSEIKENFIFLAGFTGHRIKRVSLDLILQSIKSLVKRALKLHTKNLVKD